MEDRSQIYEKTKNFVIKTGTILKDFKTESGLKQGGGLSPLLFIIFMNKIAKVFNQSTKKLPAGHHNIRPNSMIQAPLYSNDLALFSEEENKLNYTPNIWNLKLNMK